MYYNRVIGFIGVALAVLALASCRRETSQAGSDAAVSIAVDHLAGGMPLALNANYTNPHGEPLTVTAFAYYLSNIQLLDESGRATRIPNEYYLVDERRESSKRLLLKTPAGTYTALRFLMGVDSTRNVSGVQTGALDPANGMFWTWTTGYIMAKLEGRSPASTAPLQNVTYHIGGFRTGESVLREVELRFPAPLTIDRRGTGTIRLSADLMAWFNALQPVRIAEQPVTMNPGDLAMRIADNYALMWRVVSVEN